MSLILDALRKMEQERKARKQASTGIRQEVLNYRGGASKPDRPLYIPVAVAVLLSAGAVGTYLYLAGRSTQAPPAVAAPATLPPQPAPKPVPQPAQQLVPQPAPLPVPIAAPLPPPQQANQAVAQQPEKPRTKALQSMKQSEPVQPAADAPLVISGIAWQDERKLRRAVINGQLVGEGAEIQGAKVVEIRENRVKFSRNGSIFEISYP